MLTNFPGGDGIKTGFTCASGYNLAASATRDGHKIVAIVLGESSSAKRTARAVGACWSTASGRANGRSCIRRRAWRTCRARSSAPASSRTRRMLKRFRVCKAPPPPPKDTASARYADQEDGSAGKKRVSKKKRRRRK